MRRFCICIIWEGDDDEDDGGIDDDDNDERCCCCCDEEGCVVGLADDDDDGGGDDDDDDDDGTWSLVIFMRISRGSFRRDIANVDPRGKEPSLYLAICAGSTVQ